MKKFLNGIKRNMFYIALIAGMVALVGLVALYNVKTGSEDESAVRSETTQDTADRRENATTEALRETLGGTATTEEKATESTTEQATEKSMVEAAEETVLTYDGSTGLIWPINGNVVIPYSMDTTVYFETLNQYKCNPGIMIEAAEDAEAVAAYKCKITEITSNAEFGNIVTASLGNGYEMTYGQLKDIYVSAGQVLEAGTPIGTVAKPSRYYTKEGTNLYFAITKDNKPVDPVALIEGE